MTKLFLLMFLLLTPPAPQTQTGILEGTVVREGSNDPIADVEIKVTTAGGRTPTITAPDGQIVAVTPQMAQRLMEAIAGGDEDNVPEEYVEVAREVLRNAAGRMERTVVTDSAGHFSIRDIPAGNLSITAQRRGYFGPVVNGLHPTTATATTTIKEGQTAAVRLPMVAGGTISGRVFDPNGSPLIDEIVHVRRPGYENGAVSLGLASVKVTDERGEYRSSSIPPGEYYVMAIARRPIRTAGVPVPTLYPGATDLTTATRVHVRPDEELSGIDIRIRTENAGTVRGKVLSSLPAGPVASPRGQVRPSIASVTLVPREVAGRTSRGYVSVDLGERDLVALANPDGTFEFLNVRPGLYDLFARLPAPPYTDWGPGNAPPLAGNPWVFGRTPIEVRPGTEENVSVLVHHGFDLKGRVLVDGKPAAAKVKISLTLDDSAGRINDSSAMDTLGQLATYVPAIAQDGSFTIPLVPEGRYRFRVVLGAQLPPTAYLADIRQGNASVYDAGLVVRNETIEPVNVFINTDAGSIEGIVRGTDQKPAANRTVVLVPAENRRQNPALYKTAQSDAQGQFVLNTVPPGQYKIFAWESVLPGAYQNSAFLSVYEQFGAAVNVSPGSRTSAQINIIAGDGVR